jgi:hypothetical protein
MLRDNKILIYCGGVLVIVAITTRVAVSIYFLPFGADFCHDNRIMCAPPEQQPDDDEPSGKEPPLPFINALSVNSSTAVINEPRNFFKVIGWDINIDM